MRRDEQDENTIESIIAVEERIMSAEFALFRLETTGIISTP